MYEDPKSLPIYNHEAEIVRAIRDHRVIVLEGPTGSGKTTQLPRILLRAGSDVCGGGTIGITQPRRIAAVSVARRIAHEEDVPIGGLVAYAIRFDDCTGPETRVKVMTDGILLQEWRSNPNLDDYSVIVVDEAHERSLNIDLTLGLLHHLLSRRDDLRVVVSSATLKPAEFQRFFESVASGVPRVSIDARPFPIEVEYRPARSQSEQEVAESASACVLEIHRSGADGHVLVFLTGEGMIWRTARAIEARRPGRELLVLPLFGRLTREQQERVFLDFPGRRKVILATNIAETSITVPDVRFVVDSGLAKIPRFNARTGISSLQPEPISQASAAQRAGRAGRTAPGRVIRLYRRSDLLAQPEFGEEEIRRLDLSEVVLRLIDLGVKEVESFHFPSPPPRKKLAAGLRTLEALGAIDADRSLTPIGRDMVPYPLSPPLARMVVEAARRYPDVLDDTLILAGFLSARNPFLFPNGEEGAAREAQRALAHPMGDAITAVLVTRAYERESHPRDFCKRNFLDPEVMGFIAKVHRQLAEIAESQGRDVATGGKRSHVIRALLAGFFDKVLVRRRGRGYTGPGKTRISIHPSSGLFGSNHDLLVACEIVISTRAWARQVSVLQPEWLDALDSRLPGRLRRGRGREGRRSRRPTAATVPDTITIGSVELSVDSRGKRPRVDIPRSAIAHLKDSHPRDLAPTLRRWRARIVTEAGAMASGTPLGKLLALLPWMDLGDEGERPPRASWEGALLEPSQNWTLIDRELERVMRPALPSRGRRPGWLAIVSNGVGEYWFEVIHDFEAALLTTVVSLGVLAQSVAEQPERAERVGAVLERFQALQSEVQTAVGGV